MEAGTGRELDSSPALLNSINTASKIALNRFGHINTVTTVTGEANRVFVKVPKNLSTDQSCLGQTRAKSLAVKAYMVIIIMMVIVKVMVEMVVFACEINVICVSICVLRWSVNPHLVATTRKQQACCQTMFT